MDKFIIKGPTKLYGEVSISGTKNSAVAILPATLLIKGVTTLENVPNISDVKVICSILEALGAKVEWTGHNTVKVDTRKIESTDAPYDLSRKFRASYYFLGALLGRCGQASVGLPGGCNIGARPIDQHIKGFEILGAEIDMTQGLVKAKTKGKKLKGDSVYFDVISVGATINLILASVLAKGETLLTNAAKEPHIVDVCKFLVKAGAHIEGIGTDQLKITGVTSLKGNYTYSIVPDQIEAGTFMLAAIATKGNIVIKNCVPADLIAVAAKIVEMGGYVSMKKNSVHVAYQEDMEGVNVTTMPHPGFPTDLQPIMGVALTQVDGTSTITESIWESRFKYTGELAKMGAKITVINETAVIEGKTNLVGTPVYATDLRAGAALIIAGCAAKGTTKLFNLEFIDRGYENIEEKFRKLGANIQRVQK